MNNVLGAAKGHAGIVYLDYLFVIDATCEDYLSNLDKVIAALFSTGFRLNRENGTSGLQVLYLGYIINRNGISPLPKKKLMPKKTFPL